MMTDANDFLVASVSLSLSLSVNVSECERVCELTACVSGYVALYVVDDDDDDKRRGRECWLVCC